MNRPADKKKKKKTKKTKATWRIRDQQQMILALASCRTDRAMLAGLARLPPAACGCREPCHGR
jgi:hypothetical protein